MRHDRINHAKARIARDDYLCPLALDVTAEKLRERLDTELTLPPGSGGIMPLPKTPAGPDLKAVK